MKSQVLVLFGVPPVSRTKAESDYTLEGKLPDDESGAIDLSAPPPEAGILRSYPPRQERFCWSLTQLPQSAIPADSVVRISLVASSITRHTVTAKKVAKSEGPQE